jgi:hypothetical protein
MLEYKKLFAGVFVALLSINLCGSMEAATLAEKEEARMWGGFRDKVFCTVDASVAEKIVTTQETVIVKEVPVYHYPFLFIWDDWYHWHHYHHVWHRHPRLPRHHIGRPPVHRPPRPHISRSPVHRPSRPAIVRPAPRPGKPSISRRVPRPNKPQIIRPSGRPGGREQIIRPGSRPKRPAISRSSTRPGGNRPVMRPATKPRPQVRSAPPRSRSEEMIYQNGGARGGARHHGGRPSGGRGPRRGR